MYISISTEIACSVLLLHAFTFYYFSRLQVYTNQQSDRQHSNTVYLNNTTFIANVLTETWISYIATNCTDWPLYNTVAHDLSQAMSPLMFLSTQTDTNVFSKVRNNPHINCSHDLLILPLYQVLCPHRPALAHGYSDRWRSCGYWEGRDCSRTRLSMSESAQWLVLLQN